MVSLTTFVAEWTNKGIDFDGMYGFQCVDLVQQYNKECLGNPTFSGNAIDIWTTYPKGSYDQIVNTPTNAPQKGDIVIWGSLIGQYGHIDVCISDNNSNNSFTGFDQNWPLGSVCHSQAHTYFAVLGWLRPKTIPAPTTGGVSTITPDETNAIQVLTEAQKTYSQGNLEGTANFLVGQTVELANTQIGLTNAQNENTQLTGQITDLNSQIVTIKQEDVDAGQKELEAEKALAAEQEAHKADVTALQGQLTALQGHSGDLPAPAPVKSNGFFAWLTHLFGG